ncbi:MAG TPA: hypothetical protein VNI02_08640 [Blastocatellia bacterium]|nr:hypothetical protein [Blastocatellia bacterium]
MKKPEANSTNDPDHDFRTIRFLSLIIIVLGLLFCLYATLFYAGYYGQPLRLIEVILLLIPYLYLFSFFLSCLRAVRARVAAVLCAVFNVPLVLFIGYALVNLSFAGIVLSIFPTMWILLCRERLKVEGTNAA